jgi:uncharacterized damage-inducible protein DinB
MFSLESLHDLFRHMEWADAQVWNATAPLAVSPFDERLRELLLHIHVVQRAFLHVWTGERVAFPEAQEFPTPASLRAWAEPYYRDLDRFLDTLDGVRLSEPITMPWVKHFEQRLGRGLEAPTLSETMFQVTSHSTYHRAQVNTRLRELGAAPPLVDYIAWVWFGRPAHNKSDMSAV